VSHRERREIRKKETLKLEEKTQIFEVRFWSTELTKIGKLRKMEIVQVGTRRWSG